ncbi:MAG: TraB/GumN family protein [Mariprofundaceae bacterium]|nr:TraB/GumN family protein [Mariprofundaceae bacterium]
MKRIILWLLLLGWAMPVHAKSSMFELQCQGATVYLGGTVHVLKEDDFPLPDAYQRAYQASDTLVFETDMNAMKEPKAMANMMLAMQYHDDRTLQSVLKPATYAKLEIEAKKLDVDLMTLNNFRPVALMTLMMAIQLHQMGVKEGGVDAHFFAKAIQDGKALTGLESVDFQISMLATMGEGEEDEMILSSLDDFSQMQEHWDEMIQAWREGDLTELEQQFITPMRQHPVMYQQMLVARNQAWLPQILTMVKDHKKALILVGAAHLIGEDGLLQQLKQKGCQARQM